jgi:hypothetical protein
MPQRFRRSFQLRAPEPSVTVKEALLVIGRFGPRAAQDQLRKAQGFLYEAQRQDFDVKQLRAAASLIPRTSVSLMKVQRIWIDPYASHQSMAPNPALRPIPVKLRGGPPVFNRQVWPR